MSAPDEATVPDFIPAVELPEADANGLMDRGTYALYRTPDGSVVLVLDSEQRGLVRQHVPAAIVKMVTGEGFFTKRLAKRLSKTERGE